MLVFSQQPRHQAVLAMACECRPMQEFMAVCPWTGSVFSHRLASAGRQALDGRDVDLSRFSRTIVLYAKVPFVMFQDRPQLTWY